MNVYVSEEVIMMTYLLNINYYLLHRRIGDVEKNEKISTEGKIEIGYTKHLS